MDYLEKLLDKIADFAYDNLYNIVYSFAFILIFFAVDGIFITYSNFDGSVIDKYRSASTTQTHTKI